MLAWGVLLGAVACQSTTDPGDPTSVAAVPTPPNDPATPLPPSDGEIDTDDAAAVLDCVATVKTGTVDCQSPSTGSGTEPSDVFGGQGTLVNLTSSNASYVGTTFSINVTLQNLSNEAIGTPDGTVSAANGIRVFFGMLPTTTGGTGTVTVANPDGTDTFTASNQPYYQYNQILAKNAVTAAKTWQFTMPNTVTAFNFRVYVSTDVQLLLVTNELLSNPGGTISDANGEFVELYNAGSRSVQMNGLVIADSAASGRRPFYLIVDTVLVPPGGYVTLGSTKNTTNNGGIPVDIVYGQALAFANSLDAFKVARVYGTDTLTLDRTQYASAAISAQNGISRELINPSLDNSNMDGSNWADALVTAVYGPGGRGTPRAQNSTFQPMIRLADDAYRWPGTSKSRTVRRRPTPPLLSAARIRRPR